VLSGVVRISVQTTTPQSVDRVTVTADSAVVGEDTAPPFEIVWDTRREADGPYTLTARARDANGGELVSPRVPVLVDNMPPVVEWVAPADGAVVAGVVTLELTATDAVGIAAVRFLANGIAVGEATFAPYAVTWDSTTVPNIRCLLEARAFDRARNETRPAPIKVKVSNPVHTPVLAPIGPQTVPEGELWRLRISAADADGMRDPLTVQVERLPPWATFNPLASELYGTPPASEASRDRPQKPYAGVRVDVCDPGRSCDHEEFVITVIDRNRPPLLESIPDRTLLEGQPLAVTIAGQDPDDDPLQCHADRLPPWATFNDEDCTITGIPHEEIVTLEDPQKSYKGIEVKVCDPEPLCASQEFQVIVTNAQNRAPVLEPLAEQRVDEGGRLSLLVSAKDPDGQVPTLVAHPLPRGCVFTDRKDGTGTLEWTPGADQAGVYEMAFAAGDGELISTQAIRITVREQNLVISGVIVDVSGGAPVAGIAVHVTLHGSTVGTAMTDANGAYLIKGLKLETYEVKPSYEAERGFSPTANRPKNAEFDPYKYRVTLRGEDLTDADFTVRLP